MKAIETVYRGYRFRSRLEARWAVFFDELGLKWEYEPEGFEANGERWLPDFYLPEFCGGLYVEVKPEHAPSSELLRAERVSDANQMSTLFAVGQPAPVGYAVVTPEFGSDVAAFRDKYMPRGQNGKFGEIRLYFDYCGGEIREGAPDDPLYSERFVTPACLAARQARFEHGQRGAPSQWQRA